MAGFVLRVKTKSGQKVVNGLTPQDKTFQLKTKLAELTGVPAAALQVLVGFPPKPVNLDADITIDGIGIVSGDTLIVEEKRVRFRPQIIFVQPCSLQNAFTYSLICIFCFNITNLCIC